MTHEELVKCGLDTDFIQWLDANFGEEYYNQYSICTINRMHLAFIGGKMYGRTRERQDAYQRYKAHFEENYSL